MQPCELLQAAVAFVGQAYLDLPAVAASDAASDHPGKLASRNQRDDAVVLGLKALREFTNGCPLPAGKPLDLQFPGGQPLEPKPSLACVSGHLEIPAEFA